MSRGKPLDFEQQLNKMIRDEADKLILRYHAYHNALHNEYLRNMKRLPRPPSKQIKLPDYWSLDKKYNPFYTRRHSKAIARSIVKKLSSRSYVPHPPHIKYMTKKGGGVRPVSIYQIPDTAVSKIFYYRLFNKNKHRFSSFSYAYRNDRNVHFAIQDIWLDISRDARSFIAEFDFSDFFGSIEHSYLFEQFLQNGFYVSDEERFVVKAFLGSSGVGIPQGTSISLFLANLVCWRLDHSLERKGIKFARYADDTVVWSTDYAKICDAYSLIADFSDSAGILINSKKSDGISLLTREGLPAELASSKTSVDFLGYSISVDRISIKASSVLKIKKQISYLLYKNLIQPLRGNNIGGVVIPANDKDESLLTAMMQIRRYMYGGLSGEQIRNYIQGRSKRIYFKGLMSFYPLVNDISQLKQLDGWLVV